MPAETENYRLLFSLISQMEVKNIDWDKVARDVGVPTKMAAQKRWQRLKEKEGMGGDVSLILVWRFEEEEC